MYLLKKPNELKDDGTTNTNTPFMIAYDGQSVYAGFSSSATAKYFVQALRLDPEYDTLPLEKVDPDMIGDAEHVMVFRSEAQVYRLLTGKLTRSGFERSLLRL